MKKLAFTLPGMAYDGQIIEGYRNKLRDKFRHLGDEMYGIPSEIWRASDRAYKLTADELKNHIYFTGEKVILPPEDEMLEISQDPDRYMPELLRICKELDKSGEDHEGIIVISPSVVANALPYIYARQKGFEKPYTPWLTSYDVLVFDMEKKDTKKLWHDNGPLSKNLIINPKSRQ